MTPVLELKGPDNLKNTPETPKMPQETWSHLQQQDRLNETGRKSSLHGHLQLTDFDSTQLKMAATVNRT